MHVNVQTFINPLDIVFLIFMSSKINTKIQSQYMLMTLYVYNVIPIIMFVYLYQELGVGNYIYSCVPSYTCINTRKTISVTVSRTWK